jgi:hypothetical protein
MGARFREAERCGEEEAGSVVVVDWSWVIGRRCDGDNVLLVPDETTWMDGRGRHAVGPTCSLLWREHVRTCHARNGRVEFHSEVSILPRTLGIMK